MINSKPNNSNYHQGNFIPKNKNKVVKLNSKGGIYYRSSWELKVMTWFDNNDQITKWGAECITVPYQLTHYEKNGDINLKSHCYYPDFYYELTVNGSTRKIVAEVKPMKEYLLVKSLQEKKLVMPTNPTMKKLKNFEYDLKMAQKNGEKWETMIKYCDKKGWDFIVITEETLKKFNL